MSDRLCHERREKDTRHGTLTMHARNHFLHQLLVVARGLLLILFLSQSFSVSLEWSPRSHCLSVCLLLFSVSYIVLEDIKLH